MWYKRKNGSESLKQFIRYLYEYGQGKRLRNVGFVKVEQGEDSSVIHIHGKGLRMRGEKQLNLYLFYEEDGKCIGLWQGSVENVNPAINYKLTYTREDTGEPENFDRIIGVILQNDAGQRYAAVWDDHIADVEGMRLWKKEQPKEERPEEEPRPEEPPSKMEANKETNIEESLEESVPKAKEEVQSDRKCTKIRREELARLPRCEWKLANNSFLLHGYYNYHHLVLIRDSGRYLLGVPGIYHTKEAKAAAALGFPDFIRAEDLSISLEEKERNDTELFGYWCRYVKAPVK